MANVIILNKIFDGSYTEKEGNIAHEVIDFILTDSGEQYIYNTPYGNCPPNIVLEENPNKTNKDIVRYILLCSPSKINYKTENDKKTFESCSYYVNYCAEIAKILYHDYNSTQQKKQWVKNVIDSNNIIYNGKPLYDIYSENDETLRVTFKIGKMWQPKKPLLIKTVKHNFQRNKGYIYSDKHKEDYDAIIKYLEKNNSINTKEWEEVKLKRITEYIRKNNYNSKSFLDLIYKKDSEECYTNILQTILNHNNLLNLFCNNFAEHSTISNKTFKNKVIKERKVEKGRIDISADNGEQRVVIENKIYSGLNGINEEDKISQLSTYYNWANELNNPLCFIICPDFKKDDIKKEINSKDADMKDIYLIVSYSQIADFIKKYIHTLKQADFEYKQYADDFSNIFMNFGYTDKFEFFAQLFLDAIKKSKN